MRALRVIVVDDDAGCLLLMRMHWREYITNGDLIFIGCDSVEQALDEIAQDPERSVLVADICLGAPMDGRDLARTVRARWPRVPIILISVMDRDHLRGYAASADDVISKQSDNWISTLAILAPIVAMKRKLDLENATLRSAKFTRH